MRRLMISDFLLKSLRRFLIKNHLKTSKPRFLISAITSKRILAKKLAGFLFQFPPSLHNNHENLIRLNENLPQNFLIVAEFRHISWWNEEVFKIFKDKKWTFSETSFPGKLPEEIIITNPNIGYYRLHGKPTLYKSQYS